MKQPTVAASYSFPHEAHIAKASLEAAGISAQIADEHTISMQWLYSNALGGVKVLVELAQLAEAQRILNTDFSTELTTETTQRCPRCDSNSIDPYTQGKRPAFVVFLLLGFPLFYYKHGMKCQSCGHFWR